MPSSDPPPETIAVDCAVRVYFDGGCPPSTSLGSGGCLVFDPSGKLLRAAAYFYGRDAHTNNTTEAMAMVDVLKLVESVAWKREYSGVIVMGDSRLCIAFMQRRARPGKQALVAAVQECREILKHQQRRRFHFKHVLCELNALADWLAGVAQERQVSLPCVEQLVPWITEGSSPPDSAWLDGPVETACAALEEQQQQ